MRMSHEASGGRMTSDRKCPNTARFDSVGGPNQHAPTPLSLALAVHSDHARWLFVCLPRCHRDRCVGSHSALILPQVPIGEYRKQCSDLLPSA